MLLKYIKSHKIRNISKSQSFSQKEYIYLLFLLFSIPTTPQTETKKLFNFCQTQW